MASLKRFILVRLDGIKASCDAFHVVPRAWMLRTNCCYFPIAKLSSCAMEKLVEMEEKPENMKSYRRQAIEIMHNSGRQNTVLCCCSSLFYVVVPMERT